MKTLRHIIARRRPGPEDGTPAPDVPGAEGPAPTAEAQTGTGADLASARSARDRVPAAPGPTPNPRPDWVLGPEPFGHGPATGPATAPATASAPRPRAWDVIPADPAPSPLAQSAAAVPSPVADLAEVARPAPTAPVMSAAPGRSVPAPVSPGARAKTRLLGFGAETPEVDPVAAVRAAAAPAAPVGAPPRFPIGWLVVIDGPGRGASFTLAAGLSVIGRDAGQTVALDFGDPAISRERHAAIAYDAEDRRCFVGHGGKSNIVRLNGAPLLTTEPLRHGDTLRIGRTTLRYVAFCGEGFDWADPPVPEAGA